MPEYVRSVQMVVVDYICDDCGKGKMQRYGGIVYTSNPIQIPHKCDACGFITNLNEPQYPRTGWKEIEDE